MTKPDQNTPNVSGAQAPETHFGFSSVPLHEKQALVDNVFHKVASRYDLMNDLMSFGLHRAWKDALVSSLRPWKDKPFNLIDVAGGTGDVSFRVMEATGPKGHATVCDINRDMLAVGRERVPAALQGQVDFVEGNAEELPFADKTFDAYTIALGIRNVPRTQKALSEAYRVLKLGGRFLCLEFSPVDMPVLDKIYDAFSFGVIPPLGKVVTGDAQPYQYLVESIRKFPTAARFSSMIREAGFGEVSARPMTGGIVQLHSAWKV